MNKKTIITQMLIAVVCIFSRSAQSAITLMTPEFLQEMITSHTADFDFILLDVRDYTEVNNGIIASRYCKPYHMSWNFDELSENYTLLPKDVPIVVYCRSGSRSAAAASFLDEKGFTGVASLSGGINSYKGTLADSTEFKPLIVLPEPSYFGDTLNVATLLPQKQRAVIVTSPTIINKRFDLKGRELPVTSGQRNAPVYILERIGEQPTGRVSGIRRLIHNR